MRRCLRLAGPLVRLSRRRALLAACTPLGLLVTATGVATDTSVTWEVVKHVHGQLTEDDPTPCVDAQQRAARAQRRAASYVAGQHPHAPTSPAPACRSARSPSRRATRGSGAPCPSCSKRARSSSPAPARRCRTLAADRRLPELRRRVAGGPEGDRSPRRGRPARGPPRRVPHALLPERARGRPRPGARDWLDRGELAARQALVQPARRARPRPARDALRPRARGRRPPARALRSTTTTAVLPSGYEQALRNEPLGRDRLVAVRAAAARQPGAAERGAQMAWVPLQRVLVCRASCQHPEAQRDMVLFLMAHGADPRRQLPFDPGRNVLAFAAPIKSPMLAVLDAPPHARCRCRRRRWRRPRPAPKPAAPRACRGRRARPRASIPSRRPTTRRRADRASAQSLAKL